MTAAKKDSYKERLGDGAAAILGGGGFVGSRQAVGISRVHSTGAKASRWLE
jgi:hypothetical protein